MSSAGMSGSGAPARDELREALQGAVARRLPGRRVVCLDRTPAPYRSSRWLEEVTVHLDDGTEVRLVYKDMSRAVPGSDADLVKPGEVVDEGREGWVYAHLLGPGTATGPTAGRGRPPEPWALLDDGEGRVRALLLERIDGAPLSEIGSPRAWRTAAWWLADFHLRPLPDGRHEAPLLRHDRALHEWWWERAARRGALDGLDACRREKIGRAHRGALELVFEGPAAILHGEFYPSNVLAARSPGGWRVHPVDWEMAGPGPRVLDVAALTSGRWGADERRSLALAYLRASSPGGFLLDEFLRHLTAGRLLLAVQWLGWADGAWAPPAHHRTDWLTTALESAEEFDP